MSADLIANIDGWWWPASDERARPVIRRDVGPAVEWVRRLVHGRDCIVQAGANVGVYPVALADSFHEVWTFEPDPVNWACLTKNLAARDPLKRVRPFHAALGLHWGVCQPQVVEPDNCGAHRVVFGDGPVEVMSIDELPLRECDCIWLDIEGAELRALHGAERTIETFEPLVIFEDKGLHRFYGETDGAAGRWLEERGYHQVAVIDNDRVFRRTR